MEITFATSRLAKTCIAKRLLQLRAMATLADLMALPQGRPHPLTEDLRGLWAIDLKHPQRLIFSISNEPLPTLGDGRIDTKKVTKLCIERIEEDYHG